MFSFISKNWRGKPLDSIGTIVNLIANTTTKNGLQIRAEIDKSEYEKGIKISDEEMRMAFNLGIGLIAIVDKDDFEMCKKIASDLSEEAFVIGEIV